MFNETMYNYRLFGEKYGLPLVIMSCGTNNSQKSIVRENGFYCHHCLWVTKGKGVFNVDGETFELGAGEGLFCRSGVPHGYRAAGLTFCTGYVTFYGLDGILDYYKAGRYFRFRISNELQDAAASLEQFCCRYSTCISRSAVGYSFLTMFLEEVFSENVSLKSRVEQILEIRFSKDISLEEIASELSLSKYTLCRRYFAECGMTVMEQLKRIRVAKAKQLLSSTALPVSEIGKMCGFMSPSYFGKVFKGITGSTPAAYRAGIR